MNDGRPDPDPARHLALQREGALGARPQAGRPRPPLAAAGIAHPDRLRAHPRRERHPAAAAAGRPHDRRLDRDHRRARGALPGPAALPGRPRAAPPRARAGGLLRRGAGTARAPAPLPRADQRAGDVRRGRRGGGAGPARQGQGPGRPLRPHLHRPALRRPRRSGRGGRRGRRSSPPSTGSRPSWRPTATASSWSASASASPTSPPPRSSTRWSAPTRARCRRTRRTPARPCERFRAEHQATAPATSGSKRPSAATAMPARVGRGERKPQQAMALLQGA